MSLAHGAPWPRLIGPPLVSPSSPFTLSLSPSPAGSALSLSRVPYPPPQPKNRRRPPPKFMISRAPPRARSTWTGSAHCAESSGVLGTIAGDRSRRDGRRCRLAVPPLSLLSLRREVADDHPASWQGARPSAAEVTEPIPQTR